MPALKYSRQRESIKQFLEGRYDHPTADMVYMGVREEFPHISLGTVYRNLSLLAELGEITKITSEHSAGTSSKGRNTVFPTDSTAVAIIPTTAGFRPAIQPLTKRLERNAS